MKLSLFFGCGFETVLVLDDVVARVDLPILESPSNIFQTDRLIVFIIM